MAKVKAKDERCITIRFPKALWVKLRRLQEDGKISSIQGVVVSTLEAWLVRRQGLR